MEIDSENLGSIDSVEKADAVLESLERPSHEAAPEQAEKPQPQTLDEFELTVGGKSIKAKRDQVLQWAQMGYDAPNKIRQLSGELETWKQKEARLAELDKKYGEVDKFVREKPEFWDHVIKTYEQRNQLMQDSSNPLAQMVQQLQSEVQSLVQYKNQIEERQAQARMAQEDQELSQTIEKIQKSYPDIDFVTPDAEGKTLEYKVLEFAAQKKISDFDTAFKAYHHDELVKRAEGKAKESLSKEKVKNTKLGFLGISPTPTKRVAGDHRGKSWNQLAQEAVDEFT